MAASPPYHATCTQNIAQTPNLLDQCTTEQKYIRGAMLRSLIYVQVGVEVVGGY